jgi:biopolymer transport protein ExbD
MTKPQINVTPLIDVLLVLLIIFMVVTPMKPSAFDAKIPQPPPEDSKVDTNPDTLVVIVNRDASLGLNKERLAASIDEPGELIERLKNVFKLREQNLAFAESTNGSAPQIQRTVFIKAPKNLDYGSVARVLDAVKMSGASPVSLQIDDLD